MIAIIGLGNPDSIYSKTYHNMGYMAVDYFAEKHNLQFTKNKYNGMYAEGMIDGEKAILLKPTTYMNLSGVAVSSLVNQLKLPLGNLCVVYDDIDLPIGAIRFRPNGSAGTHNGMRDIIAKLGESDFGRIRIGIGKPIVGSLADFVLSKVSNDNLMILQKSFENTSEVLEKFIKNKGNLEGLSL